jgi:hypothetical protein
MDSVEEVYDNDVYNNLFEIPSHSLRYLPGDDVSVLALLAHAMPANEQRSLFSTGVKNIISNMEPNADLEWALKHRPIPALKWTNALKEELKQMCQAGARIRSFKDIAYENTYMPTWIIQFWDLIRTARSRKDDWAPRIAWVESQATSASGVSPRCRELACRLQVVFRSLGWRESIARVPIQYLMPFLDDNGWLFDDSLNLSIDMLNKRFRREPLRRQDILVGTSDIYRYILEYSESDWANSAHLKGIIDAVKDKGVQKVYLPLHVYGNHWIAVMIDFQTRTVCYGM